MYTFFLGTNTALSAGEIAAVLGRHRISFSVLQQTKHYIRLNTETPIPTNLIASLGGTIRIAEDIAQWNTMPSAEEILDALSPLPATWDIGLGAIGMSLNIRRLGVELKKAARARKSKLSFVEPKGGSVLNAAQVIFNALTRKPNADLIFIQHGERIFLVKTIMVQQIDTYEIRDTSRPVRDARIGLLPPKLAQIMINLALADCSEKAPVIYDPFCGMGTILQEAWLMGIASIGTDISEAMVHASRTNIDYLSKHFSVQEEYAPQVLQHDATSPNFPKELLGKNIVVVTEPFLGTPLTRALSPIEAIQFYESVIPLYRRFFENIIHILQKDAPLLVLLPAPRIRTNGKDAFTPLPRTFLDEIITIGYRKSQLIPKEISGVEANSTEEPLLYARPDAVIARELTLWNVR